MELTNPLSTFSTATWRSLIRDYGGEVRLGSRESPLQLTLVACDNPECPCEEVTLCFRESEGPPRRAALAFDVQVDLSGERDAEAKGLGAEAEANAKGIAAGLRGAGRQPLRNALREHRLRIKRIPKTIAGFVARSEMVPYAHVQAGGDGDDDHYAGYMDSFDSLDRDWQVMDFICGAPRCDCAKVQLTFLAADDAGNVRFAASVPIGGGAPTLEGLNGVTLGEAERVFSAWEAETAFDRPALRARYERVRSLAKIGTEPDPVASNRAQARRDPPALRDPPARPGAAPPSGRREPCPCGSGKRYKNCCGLDPR